MAEYARPPLELSSEGPMDENWRNWRQQFRIFLKASGAIDKPSDVKASLLMNLIGPFGQEAARYFDFNSPEDSEDLDILIEKFDEHFVSNVTETRQRYIFLSSTRRNPETIDQYVSTLKIRAKCCNFGDLQDTMMRDKIVLDIKDIKLREHLLGVPNLTLSQTIDLWKKSENAKKEAQVCAAPSSNSNSFAKNDTWKCKRCGVFEKHNNIKDCPAWGKSCANCGMLNHLAASCVKPAVAKNNDTQSESVKNPPNKYFNPGPFTQIPRSMMKPDE